VSEGWVLRGIGRLGAEAVDGSKVSRAYGWDVVDRLRSCGDEVCAMQESAVAWCRVWAAVAWGNSSTYTRSPMTKCQVERTPGKTDSRRYEYMV